MKIVKKIIWWLLAIPLLLIAAIVIVQTYYHFTPVPLSAEAQALNARAAKLPEVTENGYRLNGLEAPREQDPVAYGQCLASAWEQLRDSQTAAAGATAKLTTAAAETSAKQREARLKALDDACLKGGVGLALPKILSDVRIRPSTTGEQWQLLASAAVDETVMTRIAAVRGGGPKRIGAQFDSPLVSYESWMKLERVRIAQGVIAWQDGRHTSAIDLWGQSIIDNSGVADGNLIGAMISVAAQSQALVAMRGAVANAARIDETSAKKLLAAIVPVEQAPEMLANSMVGEWQLQSSTVQRLYGDPYQSDASGGKPGVFDQAMSRLSMLTADRNDTLNRFASSNLWSQQAMLAVARGGAKPEIPRDLVDLGCETGGDWGMASCMPFLRNPVGRVVSAIAMPMYADYGTRVADLRNLAAATRLTIEARRRGLTGDPLVNFVANAPDGMRDLFTGKPFAYDAAGKRLRIDLKTRSTILGEKNYELPL